MTAVSLWDFGPLTAQTPTPPPEPGPGTTRQAAVSADDLAVIQDTWTVVVAESLAPALAASYVAAAESQAARLAAALPAELAEAFAQPLIDTTQASLLYAAEASNRLVAIGDELWANARTSLVEGMAAGEDIPKLAARVRAATNVTLPRATTIARTEVVGARNAGSYDEMVASGVVTTKRWLATNDRRTRPDHRLAGGLVPGVPAQEVPIGGKFSLGGWPCDHPGDPALPPEQGINCRCTLLYEVGDDETVGQAVAGLTAALWDFHLPGKHDQSSHGKGGKGVKVPKAGKGLGKARNIGELNAAAEVEFKKITGRDVKVDMKGSDLKVAREHLEGVLEAQSKYPGVRVDRVVTYGPGGALPTSRFSRESFAESGYALTEPTIGFNAAYSSHPAIYRSDLEAGRRAGFEVFDNPRGVAIHEFGHQLEQQTASASASRRVAVASARRAGEKPTAHIDSQISTYATTNDSELSAEAFADVMLNGGSASPTSQAIFDALDTRYNAYGLGE